MNLNRLYYKQFLSKYPETDNNEVNEIRGKYLEYVYNIQHCLDMDIGLAAKVKLISVICQYEEILSNLYFELSQCKKGD